VEGREACGVEEVCLRFDLRATGGFDGGGGRLAGEAERDGGAERLPERAGEGDVWLERWGELFREEWLLEGAEWLAGTREV